MRVLLERKEECQEEEHEEDERVQVAPNMGASGSYPQAMADSEEEEAVEGEKEGMRGDEMGRL